MVIMALGYTIWILCYDKDRLTSSFTGFIIFHYILAYLAHYLARTIDEEKSHQALLSSYIQYQDDLLLPPHQVLRNTNHHTSQNAYNVNPALEPPPSYNSLNGLNQVRWLRLPYVFKMTGYHTFIDLQYWTSFVRMNKMIMNQIIGRFYADEPVFLINTRFHFYIEIEPLPRLLNETSIMFSSSYGSFNCHLKCIVDH